MTSKSKKKRPFWELFTPKDNSVDLSELEKAFQEGDKKIKELQKNKKNKTSSLSQNFAADPNE